MIFEISNNLTMITYIFMCENVDAVVAYLRENFPSDGYPPRDITCLCQR
jgi:hypothetical protein